MTTTLGTKSKSLRLSYSDHAYICHDPWLYLCAAMVHELWPLTQHYARVVACACTCRGRGCGWHRIHIDPRKAFIIVHNREISVGCSIREIVESTLSDWGQDHIYVKISPYGRRRKHDSLRSS